MMDGIPLKETVLPPEERRLENSMYFKDFITRCNLLLKLLSNSVKIIQAVYNACDGILFPIILQYFTFISTYSVMRDYSSIIFTWIGGCIFHTLSKERANSLWLVKVCLSRYTWGAGVLYGNRNKMEAGDCPPSNKNVVWNISVKTLLKVMC